MIKEIKGKWWLPDKPERRIYGTLKIYYDIFSELELFGLLKDKIMSAIFIEPKLILGQSIKEGTNRDGHLFILSLLFSVNFT